MYVRSRARSMREMWGRGGCDMHVCVCVFVCDQRLEAQEKNGKFRREKTNVQTAMTSRQMDRQTDGQTDGQTIRQDR